MKQQFKKKKAFKAMSKQYLKKDKLLSDDKVYKKIIKEGKWRMEEGKKRIAKK